MASLFCTVNTFCIHLTRISYMFSLHWVGQNGKIASYDYLQSTFIKFHFIESVTAQNSHHLLLSVYQCYKLILALSVLLQQWIKQKQCIFLFTSQNFSPCSIISHLKYFHFYINLVFSWKQYKLYNMTETQLAMSQATAFQSLDVSTSL